jgi:hypothetical protein
VRDVVHEGEIEARDEFAAGFRQFGADRLRGHLGHGTARHDLDLAVRENVGQAAIGDLELEHDRSGIGRDVEPDKERQVERFVRGLTLHQIRPSEQSGNQPT